MKPALCLLCQQPITELAPAVRYCSAACEEQAELELHGLIYVTRTRMLTRDDLTALLQDHLLREWAREIVWLCGVLEFMVCEDYTFADVQSRQVYLSEDRIQPLIEDSATWQEVLWEYAIVRLPLHLDDYHPYTNKFHRKFNEHRLTRAWTLSRLAETPEEYRPVVARNPHTPISILNNLMQENAFVRENLAKNPILPPDLLARLGEDEAIAVRVAVAQHPQTPTATLEQLSQSAEKEILLALLTRPQLSEALITQLAVHPLHEIRAKVAEHPQTPPYLVVTLAQDRYFGVRWAVLRQAKLSECILRELAKDTAENIRSDVAAHADTPPDLLAYLAQDRAFAVRLNVAQNSHTSSAVLTRLACDKLAIRLAVAQHPQTDASTLIQLAHDSAEEVRAGVAAHANAPHSIIEYLRQDAAAQALLTTVRDAGTPTRDALTMVGHLFAMSKERLLTRVQIEQLRIQIATNPHTQPDILTAYARDPFVYVRRAVAANPATPPAVLTTLAGDRWSFVRQTVAEHSSTPPAVLANLMKDGIEAVQLAALKNEHFPPAEFAQWADDPRIPIRLAIAQHPAAPLALLNQLAQDHSPSVQQAVLANPRYQHPPLEE